MNNPPDSELDPHTEETPVQVHAVSTRTKKVLPCHLCYKKFTCNRNVNRHIERRHPEHYSKKEVKEKIYSCEFCPKAYALKESFWKHLKLQHNICRIPKASSVVKPHKCDICGNFFVSQSTLRRHNKNAHNKVIPSKSPGSFKCSECQSIFPTKTSYCDHIMAVHDVQLNVETLLFENEADFESWKSDVEKNTVSFFRKDRKGKSNDLLRRSYICHRSGFFVSKNTGKRRKTSYKIDCFCPASISVRATSAGKLFPAEVNFISTHLGHAFEIGKLRIKQRQRCQQVTNDIMSGFVDKLEEFSRKDQCSEIDRAIAMLTAMKNKKENNVLNSNIEPQQKRSKRQKKGSATNVLFTGLAV